MRVIHLESSSVWVYFVQILFPSFHIQAFFFVANEIMFIFVTHSFSFGISPRLYQVRSYKRIFLPFFFYLFAFTFFCSWVSQNWRQNKHKKKKLCEDEIARTWTIFNDIAETIYELNEFQEKKMRDVVNMLDILFMLYFIQWKLAWLGLDWL